MAAQEHNTGEKANSATPNGATGNADAAAANVPEMTEADRRQVRVLTFIVVGFGVLLVAGLAVLVATVIMRASGKAPGAATAAEMTLPVPRGAVVEEMRLDGNLLALRLLGVEQREIVILDVRKGRILRRLHLREREQ